MVVCSHVLDIISATSNVVGAAAFTMFFIIVLTYMLSFIFQSPRFSLWSKEEMVQLIISYISTQLILNYLSLSCNATLSDVASLFSFSSSSTTSLLEGAENYLISLANISHAVIKNSRYYLSAIDIAITYNKWKCPIFCFFTTGTTGITEFPYNGKAMISSAIYVVMNAGLFSFMNAMMHLYFLNYLANGMFFFILPLGIILRSTPYLRKLGALFISFAFSFLVIYPTILSIFYVVMPPPSSVLALDESSIEPSISVGDWLSGNLDLDIPSATDVINLFSNGANVFFYSNFLLTLALLASIASTVYIGIVMGEEVDVSRILRMV